MITKTLKDYLSTYYLGLVFFWSCSIVVSLIWKFVPILNSTPLSQGKMFITILMKPESFIEIPIFFNQTLNMIVASIVYGFFYWVYSSIKRRKIFINLKKTENKVLYNEFLFLIEGIAIGFISLIIGYRIGWPNFHFPIFWWVLILGIISFSPVFSKPKNIYNLWGAQAFYVSLFLTLLISFQNIVIGLAIFALIYGISFLLGRVFKRVFVYSKEN